MGDCSEGSALPRVTHWFWLCCLVGLGPAGELEHRGEEKQATLDRHLGLVGPEDRRGGPRGDAGLALQMYGSQEDGSIDEDALSSILKTALGVAELTVTDLFQAIDQEEKGRITFGERPREQGGWSTCAGSGEHTCSPWPPVLARPPCVFTTQILRRKVLPETGQDGWELSNLISAGD